MSFGSILGQIMQSGMGGGGPSQSRINSATSSLGGSGLGGIFNQVQNAMGSSGPGQTGQAAGGIANKAGQWLRQDQLGGLSGAQIGGIGALAGALFDGGLEGAAKGGALAVIGTIALGALKNSQSQQSSPQSSGGQQPAALPSPQEIEATLAPGMDRLVIKAMIGAAKADGQIDQSELSAIFSKLDAETATPEEKQFLMEELAKPHDVNALAMEVKTPIQAAEVYAASLIAIHVDTDEEREYLRALAAALNLDAGTVSELHRLTGVPI